MADIRTPGATAGTLRTHAQSTPSPVSSRDLARYRYSPTTERRIDPDRVVALAGLAGLFVVSLLALVEGGTR